MQTQDVQRTIRVNREGFGGLSSDEVTKAFNNAVNQTIAKKQEKGLPVARYNAKTGRAYLENADGTQEYV
jgi:hypothetical protein